MKNIGKRILCITLLATLTASFTACANEAVETTAVTTAQAEAPTDPNVPKPNIPDDLKFDGGKIRVLGMEHLVEGIDFLGEQGVDGGVNQELYDRNRRIEDRFGITMEYTNVTDWVNELPNLVRQSVNSGSNDYDVVFSTGGQQISLIDAGMYLPLTELYWIDLEKPWWNKDYIESVSVNTQLPYVMFGHMTFNQIERTACLIANITKLTDDHNIIADDLYKLVDDGDWTLDKFTELVNLGYHDDNGNTKKDIGDRFGMTYSDAAYNYLAFSSGLEFTGRDEDGYPIIEMNNERSADLCDKLISLFYMNNAAMYSGNKEHVDLFANGQALFLPNRFCAASWWLREMKDDYIFLPYPKFDENVDGYHSVVEYQVQWGCVAVTAEEDALDMISAAMEWMAYDGYNNITPRYFETDLKLKLTRGDDIDGQSRMLDIIVNGARTDFLFMNNLNDLAGVFARCATTGTNNFASYYASCEPFAKIQLNNLIKKYDEMLYAE